MTTDESGLPHGRLSAVALSRLGVGLLQGLALYLLYVAMEDKTWPATNGLLFAPLLFLSVYVPIVLLVSLGNLRGLTLVVWVVVVGFLVAGLAWYDVWRSEPGALSGNGAGPQIFPSFSVFFFTWVGLFIAQSLVTAGDADRRFIAAYSTHFDVAWKLGLQLVLSVLFVGIFWAVLELGAELFNLIGVDFFSRLIDHRWFAIPATALALAAAVHLTDVRAGLVRGTRTLVLVLLSWLLPLMAIIAAGFLVTLVFTGLKPLWKTGFAAGYLLAAAGYLVFLINAAFQDGEAERKPPLFLRLAGSLAALLLAPLVAISAYAIALRVAQYGWTTERISATACAVVAASYAIGYATAALWPGEWLARIARWNFFTALLVLVVLLAIFSPIADPMRISVASQVARLETGKVSPEQFDFNYLRWNSGRFGMAALHTLAQRSTGPQAALIRTKARASLAASELYAPIVAPTNVAASLNVYPKGQVLPQSFLRQKWSEVDNLYLIPPCLRLQGYTCDAYVLDLAGDGRMEIAIIGSGTVAASYNNGLFAQDARGVWRVIGTPDSRWSCAPVAMALRSGKFGFAAPPPPPWRNVVANGETLSIKPIVPDAPACPSK